MEGLLQVVHQTCVKDLELRGTGVSMRCLVELRSETVLSLLHNFHNFAATSTAACESLLEPSTIPYTPNASHCARTARCPGGKVRAFVGCSCEHAWKHLSSSTHYLHPKRKTLNPNSGEARTCNLPRSYNPDSERHISWSTAGSK